MLRVARVLLFFGMFAHLAATVHAANDGVRVYVATDGNDTWSGMLAVPNAAREDGPFATLERARDELRVLKAKSGPPHGATVLMRSGMYRLREPFVLGPADSGAAGAPIVYAADAGAKVFLRGSVVLHGWHPGTGKIWQTSVPVEVGDVRFWQLYYRGERQILARTPNVDTQHPHSGGFFYAEGEVANGTPTLVPYNPARLDPAKWSRPTEGHVHVWPMRNWTHDICPIHSVDLQRHVITLAQPAQYMVIKGNRFYVDNLREELDAPGEWYYDQTAHQLYFWPPDEKDPTDAVTVPVLDNLITVQGDSATGAFVSDIQFRGLNLAETNDGLMVLSRTAECSVTASTFTHCGGTALKVLEGGHHNRIAGCDIHHVGGQAITLEDTVDWTHRPEGHQAYNVIDNNHIHDIGDGGAGWCGISLQPGLGGNASHDNVVSHNLIHDTPGRAIFFNGMRNIVEYNHVHHTGQEQSDTGAIGMGSRDIRERGSVIRFNYVHDTGGYSMLEPGVWRYPYFCWGIYLDDYTSGVHVYGNLVVNTYRGAVMVHGGQDNVIENNVFIEGDAQQIQYSYIDSVTRGRTPANPDKSMWRMTGTRCIGNVFYYTGPASSWIRGAKWTQAMAESDRNVLWHAGLPITIIVPDPTVRDKAELMSWDAWQKLGFDHHSVTADPQFVDVERGDYRLRPDSPARKLGFKPLPFDQMGLYASPERASWPVMDDAWREEHLERPGEVVR